MGENTGTAECGKRIEDALGVFAVKFFEPCQRT
jgi:hypothetical protein